MPDKYAELRAALDAGPTPGPWSACGSAGYVQAGEGHPRYTILAVAYGHDGNHQINAPGSRENGQYIAAAHPETIRALLADYDRMRDALIGAVAVAREAHAHWDADRDAKVGKLLQALSGYSPRYDPRTDAIHVALAQEGS